MSNSPLPDWYQPTKYELDAIKNCLLPSPPLTMVSKFWALLLQEDFHEWKMVPECMVHYAKQEKTKAQMME